jgi:hypothetical protein
MNLIDLLKNLRLQIRKTVKHLGFYSLPRHELIHKVLDFMVLELLLVREHFNQAFINLFPELNDCF